MNVFLKKWNRISILRKMRVSFSIIVLIVAVIVAITIFHSEYQAYYMEDILNKYHTISGFNNSIKNERDILSGSMYNLLDFNTSNYTDSSENTDEKLSDMISLNINADSPSFAYIHAIENSMESYRNAQNNFLESMTSEDFNRTAFISDYYELIKRNNYIIAYSEQLLEASIAEGEIFQQNLLAANTKYYAMLSLAILLCGIILIAVLYLIKNSIFDPLKKLYDMSYFISKGNFDVNDIEVISHDEIGSLTQTFNNMKNHMLLTINTITDKAKIEKELSLKEIENEKMQTNLKMMHFSQLQSQVNPHFLFNSLNIIASLAQIEDASMTRKMIINMSSFFRYTLQNDDNFVTLSYELNVVKTYIEIQKTRFGEKIQLDCPNHDSFNNIHIPKFIIQPIVENSVIHGISPKAEDGTIRIKIKIDGDYITIKIIDNGIGFEELDCSKEHKSIGLDNIQERITLFDKNAYFNIWSRKNVGTIITMNFNYIKGTDNDKTTYSRR